MKYSNRDTNTWRKAHINGAGAGISGSDSSCSIFVHMNNVHISVHSLVCLFHPLNVYTYTGTQKDTYPSSYKCVFVCARTVVNTQISALHCDCSFFYTFSRFSFLEELKIFTWLSVSFLSFASLSSSAHTVCCSFNNAFRSCSLCDLKWLLSLFTTTATSHGLP